MRFMLDTPPYPATAENWSHRGRWPGHWIVLPGHEPPFVSAYRLLPTFEADTVVRVHVTADERYHLYLNGVQVGRGSERGCADHWYFETYDLPFKAGENVLVAHVWALGVEGDSAYPGKAEATDSPFWKRARAPYAQMSAAPGFLLSPDDPAWVDVLATGKAPWQAKLLGGYEFIAPEPAWGTGANLIVHGDAFDWGFETGQGQGWLPVRTLEPGMDDRANDASPIHKLVAAILPPMLDEPRQVGNVRLVADLGGRTETGKIPVRDADNLPSEHALWASLVRERKPVVVPAHTTRRVLIDLENYYCAYPELVASGGAGASVRIHWQESLYVDEKASSKGNRDEIEGKYFINLWNLNDGVGDTFQLEGGAHRRYSTLWWQAGRYVEVVVHTTDDPLTLESLTIRETRYPLEQVGWFRSSDPRMEAAIPMMVRGLQMCSHETFMDCPFYEQLMYIGDTRLEVLTTYAISQDDRLARKALKMFDVSRQNSGITESRFPTRVLQIIPTFSLWWVSMLHDFALWRGDMDYVRDLMPGARAVFDAYRRWTHGDGLIHAPNGWNFVDWVPEWDGGIPPDGNFGVSSVINLQAALSLRQAAQLESWLGEPDLAARCNHWADKIVHAVHAKFWDRKRGMLADDLAHTKFSEHAQCLAILEGTTSHERRDLMAKALLEAPDLARTTIYFSFYLFETFRVLGLGDEILKRLEMWFGLVDQGLKTTIEHPEPTRSDCHAWGAHPLFHYFATFAGIRPTRPGFAEVEIRPLPGKLSDVHALMQTPRGPIEVRVRGEHIDVAVFEGIRGTVVFQGETKSIG